MKRIVSGITLTLLFIGMLTLAFNIQPVKAEPRTWTVDDDRSADFHTIQEAINAANRGDTIYVYNGTYYERVVVNETVSLVGENKDATIIDGNATSWVVLIRSNRVSMTGFTIRNGGGYSYCVYVCKSNQTSIRDNIIRDNRMDGLLLESSFYNSVCGNIVCFNRVNGIRLCAGSYYNSITNNTVYNSKNGIRVCLNSHNNTVTGNTISNCTNGFSSRDSNYNIIYHNNLINNTNQADSQDSINVWDDGYPSGGNYWSDYTGVDQDGDGIGDSSYVIDTDNQDKYPLMHPWGPAEETPLPFWMQWWFWIIVAVGIVALAGVVYLLKKRKPPTPTALCSSAASTYELNPTYDPKDNNASKVRKARYSLLIPHHIISSA